MRVAIVNRLKTKIVERSSPSRPQRLIFIYPVLNSVAIWHEEEREELGKDCLEFANYCDNDVSCIMTS